MAQTHQLAGFFRQLFIMFHKNWLLFKRNVSGTLCEIFLAFLFVLILLLIRAFVDSFYYAAQSNVEVGIMTGFNMNSNRSLVMYYPNNSYVSSVVNRAVSLLNSSVPKPLNLTVVASPDGNSLTYADVSELIAFISFPSTYSSASALPSQIEYSIYSQELSNYQYNVNSEFYSKNTYLFTNSPEQLCPSATYTYLYGTLFDPIKHAIDMTLISDASGTTLTNSNALKMAAFNCPSYVTDNLKSKFAFFSPLVIEIAFMITMLVNFGNIVVEKETKMKEYLKLVGIRWYVIWITWILRSFLPYLVLSIFITIFGSAKLNPRTISASSSQYMKKAIFLNTSPLLAFSTCVIYSFQVATFTLLLGQFFSKAFLAKIFGIIFWIITSINFYDNMASNGIKYLLCMFPNLGLTFAFESIFQFERSSKPLNFSTMYTNFLADPQTLGGILASQIAWSIIYLPIIRYIELIFPGDYGAPLPFYFPLMRSYWFPNREKAGDIEFNGVKENHFGFEPDSNMLKPMIRIKNMSKKFLIGFKEKTVVNDISINFYENQVTGLLGHNGAGKTTTTFMLAGIFAPSSGTATILGYDIRSQMDQIRTSMGICPQHDILYDQLTVQEHLDLVAKIKGFFNQERLDETYRVAKCVGLENNLNKKSKDLSGGMKRRLSVGMALIGDSKIILLDEPTSGLDPFNRRSLWDLIRNFKKDRTILLTTHFMEEADALSDRIAIMNHGEIKCCGSPLFLKNLYGSGYRLTLAKNPNGFDEASFKNLLNESLQKDSYKIETNIAAEMCTLIPFNLSPKLPNLLAKLESMKSNIGIDGYGVSSPTIEEVFLKVGSIDIESNETTSPEKEEELIEKDDLHNAFGKEYHLRTGALNVLNQIRILWIKRFWIFIRRYILGLMFLLLPFLIEIFICAVVPAESNQEASVTSVASTLGTNDLKITNYGSFNLPYYITDPTGSLNATINQIYTQANRPGVNLQLLPADNVNDYVLSLRNISAYDYMVSNYYAGMSLNYTSSMLSGKVYFDSLAFHSPASIINEFNNLNLALLTNNSSRSLTTYNVPYKQNTTATYNFLQSLGCIDTLPLTIMDFMNAIIIAFIISIMSIHISRERCNGSKQLQLLSGVNYLTYWLSNYLFDLLICLFNIVTMVIAIKVINAGRNDSTIEIYPIASDGNALGSLFFFMLISSLSWCTFAYIFSFHFSSEIIVFVVLFILLGLASFLDMVWSLVQVLVQTSGTDITNTSINQAMNALKWIFAFVFPNVTVKRAFFNLKIINNTYCVNLVNDLTFINYGTNLNYLSMQEPGIGIMFIFAIIQFLIGIFIIMAKETGLLRKIFCGCCDNNNHLITPEGTVLESDVKAESERINGSNLKELSQKEPLIVNQLFKIFKKDKKDFIAVNHLTFGVSRKECFGLLGLNGAGKSTTFKMLTGELNATTGNAYINGFDINNDKFSARKNLGFCPQFDYLPEFLTVKQTFKLFANLRGLNAAEIENVMADFLKVFKLKEFEKKLVQELSGGNKRKVSSAIAFIGRPSCVFLDEPTTGMDPAARRYLWTVIIKARDLGMTVVLTTHSMEESEALSTRLGIMVDGQFKCLGSVQHLKNKYGRGYTLIIKVKQQSAAALPNNNNPVDDCERFVQQSINYAKLKDKQQDTLFYQIECDDDDSLVTTTTAATTTIRSKSIIVKPVVGSTADDQIAADETSTSTGSQQINTKPKFQTIAELFGIIEANKERLNIETYTLSQTTLEQIFLFFAAARGGGNSN